MRTPYPESCPKEGEGYIIPDREIRAEKSRKKKSFPFNSQVSEDRLQAQSKVHVQRDG